MDPEVTRPVAATVDELLAGATEREPFAPADGKSENRARLPHGKDAALTAFRAALERQGIDTAPWWDRQLALCLLGALVQFGWEKALGDGEDAAEELAWWEARALEGARFLA